MYSYVCELREVFDSLTGIAQSDILDFDQTKDLIAQKLVTIQSWQAPFEEAKDSLETSTRLMSSPTSGVDEEDLAINYESNHEAARQQMEQQLVIDIQKTQQERLTTWKLSTEN